MPLPPTTTPLHVQPASLAAALAVVVVVVVACPAAVRAQARDGGIVDAAGGVMPFSRPVLGPRDGGAPTSAANTDASVSGETAPEAPDPPTPADDSAAAHALGSETGDAPDPVAEEGERTGSAEGEPIPPRASVSEEIAALSDRACYRALARAHVPFERVHHHVAGVAAPVRVTGPIHGVRYAASDRREVHELMDCRLAVALVRFSRMLERLGVIEVRHYSTYRPPDEDAARRQPVQARHAGGLAIDAAWFNLANGQRYNVERDFHGRRGRPVCGPEARVPHDAAARLMRTIACDAGRLGLFHVILTPNYNYQHRNHFHLEVTRNASWRAVH